MNKNYEYKCALGFVKGTNFVSRIIKRMTKPDDWTPSHAYLHISADSIQETEMLQGVRIKSANVYAGQDTRIYSPQFLNPVIRENMVTIARYTSGDRYGMLSIPLFLLDSVFSTFWFTQKLRICNFKVCSQYVAWLYKVTPKVYATNEILYKIARGEDVHPERLNYEFGGNWKSMHPNAMQNWCEKNTQDWKSITKEVHK